MHEISLITTIALSLAAALVFGLFAKRLGLSPIIGYLIAGIIVGPYTPGISGDPVIASQLAEIGVILLMFGVGLHFRLKDLLAVKSIAIPGAIGQSFAATVACTAIAVTVGWSWQEGIVFGIAVSVASTVVLLRSLLDMGLLDTPEGHAAVGWLVVEDIITVLVLVLLPPLAASADGEGGIFKTAGIAVVKLVVLTVIMMFAGARFVPHLLHRVARLRSRELFTLTVLVMAISVATVSYLAFGASMALGAFLAGMVVGQSKVSHQAAADALPLRDAFAVLFFVAVGMLFDYRTVLDSPFLMIGIVAVIIIVKPLAALVITLISGYSLRTGLTVAGGLAQIGEFSFILAEFAKSLKLIPGEAHNVLVAGAIISISLNPWIFRSFLALEPRLSRIRWLNSFIEIRGGKSGAKANARAIEQEPKPSSVRSIVVGYGPVGQNVAKILYEFGIEPTIIELNIDTVLEIQAEGHHAIYGDASRSEILGVAGITTAKYLIVTMPHSEMSLGIVHTAREENPEVRILARARFLHQVEGLEYAGTTIIRCDEAEAAHALAEALLQDIKAPKTQIEAIIAAAAEGDDPKVELD
ncbi:MAG: cation:proton antiporter [Candidatus Dadabacteria bacterium]|nr:cation:proton antiporter [Candidatus Dadabacteria bacterium]